MKRETVAIGKGDVGTPKLDAPPPRPQAQQKFTVYVGFDPRERLAYDVARRSILRHTLDADGKTNVRVVPIELRSRLVARLLTRPIQLRDSGQMWCPISDAPMATEFAISRFLVPFLEWPRRGWALFVDCDVILREDVRNLFAMADPKYAVLVVKHDHKVPAAGAFKMDGKAQTNYARKNWSSVVLWNCGHPANEKLTLDMVNTLPGRDLHAFKWLPDEAIGALPPRWNHLVNVSSPGEVAQAGLLHYTLGGPWIPGWARCPLDGAWLEECAAVGLLDKVPAPAPAPAT